MDPLKVDKRTVLRNLDKNIITEKEYQKYLAGLKDMDGEFEEIEVFLNEEDDEQEESVEEVLGVVPVPVFPTSD
jgi:hypothetical protein